jgi:23S rRNA pseudouridine2604 synthase
MESMILNKYISAMGLGTRREADDMIKTGRLRINGKVAKPGDRITEHDKITLDGAEIGGIVRTTGKKTYIAFYKMRGMVCSANKAQKNNIVELIGHEKYISPIGKLSKETEGLVLLTDDQRFNAAVGKKVDTDDCEYMVTLNRKITKDMMAGLSKIKSDRRFKLVQLKSNRLSKVDIVVSVKNAKDSTIISIFSSLGYRVKSLTRTRIGTLRLTKLKPGKWRNLNHLETTNFLGQFTK